jgi:3-isopropylmalate/(R)-2-methylmalate dehydratase large subunit
MAGATISEKILARTGGQETVTPGDIVSAKVDMAMSHDNAALVSKVFKTIGVPKVWDKDKIVIPIDHRAPANVIKTAEGHKAIREFVKEQGIPNFYDIKAGICHQIMPEKGHVAPGMLIVGTDSHTTTYGAFGAMSTGIGATEMAGVWATGELWLRVPDTYKINLSGNLPKGVYAKDIILYIIGDLRADGADYRSVEFYGETVLNMSVSERMTICNMSMEMGAKAAIVPPDDKTLDYIRSVRPDLPFDPVHSDEDAKFEKELEYDVSSLEPQISCPHTVDNVKPLSEVQGTEIHQALIGSCTNGRLDDLQIAASILDGKTIHRDVRLLVIPASQDVYLQAMEDNTMQKFVKAGGLIINPGCGPCLGAHQGILAEGERAIASTNRNFRGRMGSPDSEVYLSSPAVVAASAIKGEIADPRELIGGGE